MACAPKNLTEDQVRAKALHNEFYGDISPLSTPEQKIAALIKQRDTFVPMEVQSESLPRSTRRRLMLDKEETTQVYVSKDQKISISQRFTHQNTAAWLQTFSDKKAAEEFSKRPDNTLLAEMGTAVHEVNQNIMESFINQDKSNLIKKNDSPEYGFIPKEDIELEEEIIKLLRLQKNPYKKSLVKNLKQGIKEVFEEIKKTQEKIDPSGQATILTEQFLGDYLKDIGGTIDLFVMYSDGSVSLFDYKTKTPNKVEWVAPTRGKAGYYRIADSSWVPRYMIEGLERQLGTTMSILRNRVGITKFRHIRGIPIHTQYRKKSKSIRKTGERLTDQLITLTMGTNQDRLLEQIPVKEVVENKNLDRAIAEQQKLLHNYLIDVDKRGTSKARREELKQRIGSKRGAINSLILRQDMSNLYQDYSKLIERYTNEAGELLDIDNKDSKNFLSPEMLNDLLYDLEAYKQMLENTEAFLSEVTLEGQPVGDNIDKVYSLNNTITKLVSNLKAVRYNRTVTSAEDQSAIENMPSIGVGDSYFLGGKEFVPKVLRMLHGYIDEANAKKILDVQTLERNIQERMKGLQEWARKNSTSLNGAYRRILAEYNLIGKYSTELLEDIKKLTEEKNSKGLKKIFTLKEGAEKVYKDRRDDFMRTRPEPYEIKNWELSNTLENSLVNKKTRHIYYEFREEIKTDPKYLSAEYQFIIKPENKELLDFYNMWTNYMETFRDLLEIQSYEELPNNFLPWIMASVQDLVSTGTMNLSQAKELSGSWWNLKADDTMFGYDATSEMKKKIDLDSGIEKLEIPQFFINPLKNNKGRIDAQLKLRDLGASLIQFGNMAYNYHHLTTVVEPHIEALRDAITIYGNQYRGSTGKQKIDSSGRAAHIKGKLTDLSKNFEDQIKYHVYGKKVLDENAKLSKRLLNMKQFHSNYQLAGAWLTWLGNAAQIFGNTLIESEAGYFFEFKHFKRAVATSMRVRGKKEYDLYKELIYFFEPHSDMVRLKQRGLKSSRLQKILDSDTNYYGFRVSEHGVENLVLYSLLLSHGIDKNGNIVRLKDKNTPKDTKSILERSKIVNGNLIIEGLKDSKDNSKINITLYSDIRNRARSIAKNIKGGNDTENQYRAQMYIAGKMFMHYKGWLPGMISQRLGGLRYDPMTKSMRMGWWKALYGGELKPAEGGLVNYIATQLVPTLGKLSLSIATTPLGIISGGKLKYKFKANETRARRMFEAYKQEHVHDAEIQAMKFEDFVDFMQGRMRAAATEAFVMISLILSVMGMRADWDDDGLPDWQSSWASRTSFRILNRARRELSFMISINDWKYTITRSPFPAVGVIEDAMKVLDNTVREAGDFVWSREESEEKGSGLFKYTPKMFPWYKAVRSLDMINEEFEKYEI